MGIHLEIAVDTFVWHRFGSRRVTTWWTAQKPDNSNLCTALGFLSEFSQCRVGRETQRCWSPPYSAVGTASAAASRGVE